jgi:hypothetical protein
VDEDPRRYFNDANTLGIRPRNPGQTGQKGRRGCGAEKILSGKISNRVGKLLHGGDVARKTSGSNFKRPTSVCEIHETESSCDQNAPVCRLRKN